MSDESLPQLPASRPEEPHQGYGLQRIFTEITLR